MTKKTRNKFTSSKKDLRKEILEVFRQQPGKPLNHKQVAAALGIKDEGLRRLIYELLQVAAEEGTLKQPETGKFLIKEIARQSYEGRIEINRYGKGFVTIEGIDKDVEIPKGKTGLALFGDIVEVEFNPRSRNPSGKIIRVTERGRTDYVGIIEQRKGHHFMVPGDQRIHVEFFIRSEDLNGARPGEKVVVELVEWEKPDRTPIGRVNRVLGRPGDHQTEMHAIMAEYGLPFEFPSSVHEEAKKVDPGITEEEIARRRDFRGILTFTIDPYDAKDFDDALSFRRLENGHIEVGVHIADVTHYVKPGMLTDQEGLNRGTSVYLVDRTIPMLPENISNFLCSLRPDEDKLTFSAVFELDDHAAIVHEWFGRTVIHSQRRFTYEEAQLIIETGKGDHAEEVLELDRLAKKLRAKRFRQGSIDFDTDEVKFRLDPDGNPIGVFVKQMKDSNRLIEDFMLLANRRVAEFIGSVKKEKTNKTKDQEAAVHARVKTFVYRVHDSPDPQKLEQLRMFLKHIGYKLPRPTDSAGGNVLKELIRQADGQPEEDIIRQMAIRTMAKAEYSTKNIGHFGLAFDFYTHFTSPIRRYPDMMVHRLLQRYLDNGQSADEREYERMCRHSSLMEKRAAEAERASIKYKQVEYMLKHRGDDFEGIISGLSSWGIYVVISENKCEGMIPVPSLRDDMYEFDSDKYILRGVKKHREFQMGDTVRIRVEDGDLQKRTLDFSLAD